MAEPDIRFSLANERTFLATSAPRSASSRPRSLCSTCSTPRGRSGCWACCSSRARWSPPAGGWLRFRQADRAIRAGRTCRAGPRHSWPRRCSSWSSPRASRGRVSPAHLVVCVDSGSTFTKAAPLTSRPATCSPPRAHPTTLPDAYGTATSSTGTTRARAPSPSKTPVPATPTCCLLERRRRAADRGRRQRGARHRRGGRRRAVQRRQGRARAVRRSRRDKLVELRAAEPDVVLLVGGTDGGNAEVLEGDADVLSRARWTGPGCVAGNVESQAAVDAALPHAHIPHVLADNVVPRIGGPPTAPAARSGRSSSATSSAASTSAAAPTRTVAPSPTSCAARPPTWCSPAWLLARGRRRAPRCR